LFGPLRRKGSKDIARERLQFVIVSERIPKNVLEMMRAEILKVITNYVEIDEGSIDLQVEMADAGDGRRKVPALVANVPIIKVKVPGR